MRKIGALCGVYEAVPHRCHFRPRVCANVIVSISASGVGRNGQHLIGYGSAESPSNVIGERSDGGTGPAVGGLGNGGEDPAMEQRNVGRLHHLRNGPRHCFGTRDAGQPGLTEIVVRGGLPGSGPFNRAEGGG